MPSGNSGTERPEGAGESRIGPNAILQVAAALRAAAGEEAARRVFAAAGLEAWLDHPPERMVPESAVAALHQALRAELDAAQARHVLQDAGVRTGDYVLAWRIPAPVRTLLR
ncbi:bacteriochlorophyll 4-vinyl reductase, partial [Halorhodospira neutriphila]|nr:bacteriochlorophyll 4-vinyl reductase [Halorhodospira neutriphila]